MSSTHSQDPARSTYADLSRFFANPNPYHLFSLSMTPPSISGTIGSTPVLPPSVSSFQLSSNSISLHCISSLPHSANACKSGSLPLDTLSLYHQTLCAFVLCNGDIEDDRFVHASMKSTTSKEPLAQSFSLSPLAAQSKHSPTRKP